MASNNNMLLINIISMVLLIAMLVVTIINSTHLGKIKLHFELVDTGGVPPPTVNNLV